MYASTSYMRRRCLILGDDIFDGYDTIEFLAKQSWCNEKVDMAGNSWLAISQVGRDHFVCSHSY
jgi:predicted acyl esterase